MVYATTLQVNEFMRWDQQIPNYPTTTTLETVDDSGTLANGSKIYLDKANVIDGTYTISYGATAASVTALTETTHYTIDLTKSEITITTAGATAIGSNSVFAEYKYNDYINDSVISDIITRVTKDIDHETERYFDGLTLITREEHTGRGKYSRIYKPRNNLPYVVKATLTTTIDDSETEIVISDTTGLEAGDYLSIGTEALLIDSVDDGTDLTVTRAALSTTAAAHTAGDWLINYTCEKSNSPLGTTPSFSFLEFRKDYDVDSDTGALQLLHISSDVRESDIHADVFPLQGVFYRVKISYKYGTLTVPTDITDACIFMTVYKLTLMGIAKSLPEGRDGFNPTAQKDLMNEAKNILKEYNTLLIDGF